MGDPLSVASSVVGIISLGIQVGEGLFKYYNSYKDQDKNVHRFVTNLEKLLNTLKSLSAILDNEPLEPQSGRTNQSGRMPTHLQQVQISILDCRDLIEELKDECDKITTPSTGSLKGAIRVTGRRILYPFRESTLVKLYEDIESVRDNLTLAVNVLQVSNNQRVRDDVLAVRKLLEIVQATQLSSEIQGWLNAPDATVNHNIASAKRHAESGLWFINGSQFSAWMQRNNSFLWLRGFAGTGKSVLCSTAIHATFEQQQKQGSTKMAIAFFYFTFNDANKQKLSSMLQAFLRQIAPQCTGGEQELELLYEESKSSAPSNESMLLCLQRLIDKVDDTYLFLDALDEVPQGPQRLEVLEAIKTIRSWSHTGLHLLVTSRDIIEIRDSLSVQPQMEVVMKNEDIDKDIQDFVTSRLKSDFQLSKWKNYHDKIQKALTDKARGVFRWVECQLESIRRCPRSGKRLDQCLNSLPNDLDATYERILSNISEDSKEDALRILTILCYSLQPLTVSELADAVAVDLEEPAHLDRYLRLTDADSILEVCPGLIEMYFPGSDDKTDMDKDHFQQVAEVRIAHFSVQEYLESTRQNTEHSRHFALDGCAGHAKLARICLAYLHDPGLACDIERQSDLEDLPLSEYAAASWFPHYQHAGKHQGILRPLISNLFMSSPKVFENSIRLNNPDIRRSGRLQFDRADHEIGGALYFASLLGLEWVVIELIATGVDVNVEGGYGKSALVAATYKGQELIMRLLIDAGADLTPCTVKHGNALLIACAMGNESAVRLLIEHKADVNDLSLRGTPLSVASENGHEKIVKLLLDHGAQVDLREKNGTPLQMAASEGHENIVRFLLQNGANPLDEGGRQGTALQAAAKSGNLQIIQLLLDLGANVNAKNGKEGTALQNASRNCHEPAVRLLLDQGADIKAGGGRYGTALQALPFSNPSKNCMPTYHLLLERGADIYIGPFHTSVFHRVFKEGHKDAACALLDRFIIPSDDREHYLEGLYMAAQMGHVDLVDAIIDRSSALTWFNEEMRWTALEEAAKSDEAKVTTLLIENAPEEYRDNLRNNALLFAISSRSPSVVVSLLDEGADIKFRNDKYGTVFEAAASTMTPSLIRLLIDRGVEKDVSIMNRELLRTLSNDLYYHEALFWLDIGADANARLSTAPRVSALHLASWDGNETTVKLLLDKGADINAQDDQGHTALHYAVWDSQVDVVKLLLDRHADVNVVGTAGTAFDIAQYNDSDSLADLFVELSVQKDAKIAAIFG